VCVCVCVHEGGSKGFVESLTLLSQRLNARGGEGVGKGGGIGLALL
jgi:hypothetical protein